MSERPNLIDVGRINSAFGVQGWVKVQSATEPEENLFSYSPWWLKTRHGVKAVDVVEYRQHGKGWAVKIKGVDDRDGAEQLNRVTIAIERSQFQPLAEGEYYWHQLQGMKVITEFEGSCQCLGKVVRLLETGANDVLVVQGDDSAIDERERLIPYVPEQFITLVDLQAQEIRVDWDPDF